MKENDTLQIWNDISRKNVDIGISEMTFPGRTYTLTM